MNWAEHLQQAQQNMYMHNMWLSQVHQIPFSNWPFSSNFAALILFLDVLIGTQMSNAL